MYSGLCNLNRAHSIESHYEVHPVSHTDTYSAGLCVDMQSTYVHTAAAHGVDRCIYESEEIHDLSIGGDKPICQTEYN